MSFIKLEFRDNVVFCEVSPLVESFLSPEDFPLYFQNLNLNGSKVSESIPMHVGTWRTKTNVRDQLFRVVTKKNVILKELKYDYSIERPYLYLYEFWDYFIRTNKDLVGLILGAGNGLWGEWVRSVVDNNVRCFLVEGSTSVYKELETTFKNNEKLYLMNELISLDGKDAVFYDSKDGFSSVSNNFINKYIDTRTCLIEERKTKKFNDLLNEVGQVNWIRFDLEGVDYELIMSLDFSAFTQLKMVQYEHLDLDKQKKDAVENKFLSNGYELISFDIDTVFIKK